MCKWYLHTIYIQYRNRNGTFAFQKADHLRDFILRRDLNEHVNMVRLEVAFQDLAVLLSGQSMKDLSQTGTDISVQPALSHLRDEDDMILAVPLRVRQTVVHI